MKQLVIVLVLAASTNAFADERPTAWLFRATPGFGYSWDAHVRCGIQGPMTVGGWFVGKFVTPSLNVGGGLSAGVGGASDIGCMLDDSGGRLLLGTIIGPNLVWYPRDRGFHLAVHAGFAGFDQSSKIASYGAGGTFAIGYDWADGHLDGGDTTRFGLALQATVTRMTGGHAMMMPSLVMTVGVD
jgi:hypothetical protein